MWYNIEHAEVLRYSPALANRKAARAAIGLQSVVAELLRVMRPQESPLIIARDLLLAFGATPPVIMDEFWLDAVEASNRVPGYGMDIPAQSYWGRWSFPLPENEGDTTSRGERLAWAAMQLQWTRMADRIPISVTTEPPQVLDFIRSQPGLSETCQDFPLLTIEYAPQLTIRGFGGELESMIEEAYKTSLRKTAESRIRNRKVGTSLISDREAPYCEEEWSLRHPKFGGHSSVFVAQAYFHSGIFGPQVALHADADHLIWLLSKRSEWLPKRIREILFDGLCRCTAQ